MFFLIASNGVRLTFYLIRIWRIARSESFIQVRFDIIASRQRRQAAGIAQSPYSDSVWAG